MLEIDKKPVHSGRMFQLTRDILGDFFNNNAPSIYGCRGDIVMAIGDVYSVNAFEVIKVKGRSEKLIAKELLPFTVTAQDVTSCEHKDFHYTLDNLSGISTDISSPKSTKSDEELNQIIDSLAKEQERLKQTNKRFKEESKEVRREREEANEMFWNEAIEMNGGNRDAFFDSYQDND